MKLITGINHHRYWIVLLFLAMVSAQWNEISGMTTGTKVKDIDTSEIVLRSDNFSRLRTGKERLEYR